MVRSDCGIFITSRSVFYVHLSDLSFRKKCCKGFKFVLGQCIPEGMEMFQSCLDGCLRFSVQIYFGSVLFPFVPWIFLTWLIHHYIDVLLF